MSPQIGLASEETSDTVHMYGMNPLTTRQQEILDFIKERRLQGRPPSAREIADHFGFRSPGTVADHIAALRRKGLLKNSFGRARSTEAVSAFPLQRRPLIDIPLYGVIPAGFAQGKTQETQGCISVDAKTLGIRPTAQTFALEVRGDSMIGKHILDGDCVILEHGVTPRPGDVVAALIDNENTLKTYLVQKGQPFLHAENPKYSNLIPVTELVIQGVMVGLIRRTRT